ncbi:MAG: relaxase/mobilization nuclease domain-containing protein [Dysosmobacter sp.]
MAIVHFVNYKRGTQSRAAMRGVMLYVMQEKKTAWEGGPLVSGINCQPQSVYDDFLSTKLLYHKDGGVMFYHMVQSFPKGAAVDPRQAHEASAAAGRILRRLRGAGLHPRRPGAHPLPLRHQLRQL